MEFTQIFTEMQWLPALLLIMGVVLIFVELFVPGFGFFGIGGILSTIAGVVVRIFQGLNVTQSLTLILLVLGFFTLSGMFLVFSAQYGILGRTGLFDRNTTLSKGFKRGRSARRSRRGIS